MSIDLSRLTHVEVAALWNMRTDIFKADEVDLKDNVQVDSSGIAFLVQWAKSCQNGRLTLLHSSDNVKALIKTFHLEPLFELKD